LLWKEKKAKNLIYDCKFNFGTGEQMLMVTVGQNHVTYWNLCNRAQVKGTFNKSNITTFVCCAFDNKNRLYTGSIKGEIYLWMDKKVE